MFSLLYQAARRGEMTRRDAERQLSYVRGLRIRLWGDRVLQEIAWKAGHVDAMAEALNRSNARLHDLAGKPFERIAGRMSLLQPGAAVLGGIGSNPVLAVAWCRPVPASVGSLIGSPRSRYHR